MKYTLSVYFGKERDWLLTKIMFGSYGRRVHENDIVAVEQQLCFLFSINDKDNSPVLLVISLWNGPRTKIRRTKSFITFGCCCSIWYRGLVSMRDSTLVILLLSLEYMDKGVHFAVWHCWKHNHWCGSWFQLRFLMHIISLFRDFKWFLCYNISCYNMLYKYKLLYKLNFAYNVP